MQWQRWEYHTERPGSIDQPALISLLNGLSDEGWVFVGPYQDLMIFKKPVCDHAWVRQRAGGPPDDHMSLEVVEYCELCGCEKQDD